MELRLRVYTQFGWEIMVGAVLIKNYSSFEKYVKKVPCGFLKISSYRSTLKNPYVMTLRLISSSLADFA